MTGPAHRLKPLAGLQEKGKLKLAGPSHTCLSQQLHPWPTSVPLFASFCLCPAGTEPVAADLQPRIMQADQHDSPEHGSLAEVMRYPHQEAVQKDSCCWLTTLAACFCCNIDHFVCQL